MTGGETEGTRRVCNFSIDHILNRAGASECIANRAEAEDDRNYEIHHLSPPSNADVPKFNGYTFQWLHCTRYHPPKLQRNGKREVTKRQPGRHPRIPFTPLQIESLEKSYKQSAYLCPEEVTRLSKHLDLSDMRIKIWFQNRRAREKREREAIKTEDNSFDFKQD